MNDSSNLRMSYDVFKKRFNQFIKLINANHTLHDTRHTFATKCDEIGISETTIKILMGHSLAADVTNDVYIHKTVQRLKNEIERIQY